MHRWVVSVSIMSSSEWWQPGQGSRCRWSGECLYHFFMFILNLLCISFKYLFCGFRAHCPMRRSLWELHWALNKPETPVSQLFWTSSVKIKWDSDHTLMPHLVLIYVFQLDKTNSLSTGLEHTKSGNYEEAFICFKTAADQGYSKAQFNVGVCYEKGRGVHKDREQVCIFDSTLTVKIHWMSLFVFFFFYVFIFMILCEGSVSLLASSSWGPQAGSVPPCKTDSVQQEAEEHRRAEHSHQFPGAVSHSRTHWGINDDKPWPALLTGIIVMLQNSLHSCCHASLQK